MHCPGPSGLLVDREIDSTKPNALVKLQYFTLSKIEQQAVSNAFKILLDQRHVSQGYHDDPHSPDNEILKLFACTRIEDTRSGWRALCLERSI